MSSNTQGDTLHDGVQRCDTELLLHPSAATESPHYTASLVLGLIFCVRVQTFSHALEFYTNVTILVLLNNYFYNFTKIHQLKSTTLTVLPVRIQGLRKIFNFVFAIKYSSTTLSSCPPQLTVSIIRSNHIDGLPHKNTHLMTEPVLTATIRSSLYH